MNKNELTPNRSYVNAPLAIDTPIYDTPNNKDLVIPSAYTPKRVKGGRPYKALVLVKSVSEQQPRKEHSSQEPEEYGMSVSSNLEQQKILQLRKICISNSHSFLNPYLTPPSIRSHKVKNGRFRECIQDTSQPQFFGNTSEIYQTGGKFFKKYLKKKRSNLKETSSTALSTQNLNLRMLLPSFFKTKSLANIRENGELFTKEDFTIISKLAEGKFGKVYLVKENRNNFLLAMKVVEKALIVKENLLEQFIRQLKIQTYLNHPGLIKLYGFFDDQQFFYNLMELGCGGSLYKLISSKKMLSEESTSFIAKSLLTSMHYMHSEKILHRDIKPENIVLVHGTVKICDFGWAVNKKDQLRSTFCGTPLYFSPELLSGNSYDEKVDLWAIGILCFELHLNKIPFDIHEQGDLCKILTDKIKFPKHAVASPEFCQFIEAILTKDPKQRMGCKQMLETKFIERYGQVETCEQVCV